MPTTLNEIVTYIYSNHVSEADAARINAALRDAYDRRQSRAKAALYKGVKVEWMSGRYGMLVRGTVEKVNRVNVDVIANDGRKWRCTPAILKVVA